MLQYEGKYLKQQHLFENKSQRTEKHSNWPTQPCLNDKQWREWRTFICRKYTVNGGQQWKYPVQPNDYMYPMKGWDSVNLPLCAIHGSNL